MSYSFHVREPISDSVKRIALEELDKVVQHIRSKELNRDDAVHEARVSLKKLRALLRLIQRKHNAYRIVQEKVCFRNAARRMSEVRDAAVMIETFDKLNKHYPDQLVSETVTELRKPLLEAQKKQRDTKNRVLAEVARILQSARKRVTDWPIDGKGFAGLRQGLKRVYKQGRTTMIQAQSKPSVENLHEWRKRVKDLGYQIRLLKSVWQEMFGELAHELERLADYLSEDHDLALLHQTMLRKVPKGQMRVGVVGLIDQRRGELQVEAQNLGARVYGERPSAFVRRVEVYWRAWYADRDSMGTETAHGKTHARN